MITDPFKTEKFRYSCKSILNKLGESFKNFSEVNVALLDHRGDLIEVTGSNPLHFASFEFCSKAIKKYITPKHGEILITNDPYSGNTRLCDLFFIQGAFGKSQANDLRYYLVLQVSVPQLLNKNLKTLFTTVEDEGYRIPPTPLDVQGLVNPALLDYLCQSGMNRDELMQLIGEVKIRLKEATEQTIQIETTIGSDKVSKIITELRTYSEDRMRSALLEIPDGEYLAHDYLDNDGYDSSPIRIQCQLTCQGHNILLSFAGSSKQTKGPMNLNYATTLGACFWIIRSLVKEDIPVNSGAFKAFSIEAPEGTIVNARYPAPMLGGYFETSKRIVDVIMSCLSKALPLEIPALSGGSSNVTLMKSGDQLFVDAIGCGVGASRDHQGSDCIQTNLHNTSLTSIEVLEKTYPLQVTHCSIRDSSGATGKKSGGNGITRGYKFLKPTTLMLLSDRRHYKPHSLFGGVSGLPGENVVIKSGEKKKIHNEKKVIEMNPGDTLIINTPGGGAWGKEEIQVEN
ncbi:MAG: hydantoinase B/oxoprolinase family protein [Oligoflexia bacterium]|nr:hydantoinase B/oxoprolinase family protein [Oligoflexia bacterium]